MPGHARRSVVVAQPAPLVARRAGPAGDEARQMANMQSGIQQVMEMMAAQTEEIRGLKAQLAHEMDARQTLQARPAPRPTRPCLALPPAPPRSRRFRTWQAHCGRLQQQLHSLHPDLCVEPTFEPAASRSPIMW